jgi:cytochrome c oxidase subunit 3
MLKRVDSYTRLSWFLDGSLQKDYHGFHIPRPSPWPFFVSMSLFPIMLALIEWFHYFKITILETIFYFSFLFFIIGMWGRDVVVESTFQGYHTSLVQANLRLGFILFLVSEAMFFITFFVSHFYYALSPSIWIGCTWPPKGIEAVNPFGVPLLNTVILVSSGFGVTYSHRCMLAGDRRGVTIGLLHSIVLGFFFILFQFYEYVTTSFSINDSVFGSIFFVTTGFHGVHVMLGVVGLIIGLIRHIQYHFTIEHHLGFEFAIWYWHFVDVIWILLYLFFYLGNWL